MGKSQGSYQFAADLPGTRSIRRTCSILRLLGESAETGATLAEVADATELPKSSAHRYLLVLEKEGFIERDALSQRFRLGLAFLTLHTRQADWLVERARPLLEKVRDKWDESVNLGMLIGDSVVYLDIVESPRAIRLAARRGERDSLHCTALGKVNRGNVARRTRAGAVEHDGHATPDRPDDHGAQGVPVRACTGAFHRLCH